MTLDLERAMNPRTPESELRDLADRGGELGKAVASNVGTPGDLLVSLAVDWPQEVAMNSSLPRGITNEKALMSLLVVPDCPQQIFWDCIASLQPDVAYRMVGHDLTSDLMVALVEKWREMTGGDELGDSGAGTVVMEELCGQKSLPPSLFRRFLSDAVAREFMAQNPACPKDILEELSRDSDAYVASLAQETLAGIVR